ncbi:hypothetical protein T4E_3657 [Trichinella pseudospiralis]|uniref:Uncharacterized protein n=1 Tax=Trichinella pseudospiralis TaxID=6337 RepID=A0A0V0Y3B2_TRIPS|nr:hypothetical protein T4E_3657 [Trichinella pseudospiralis]
MPEYENVELDVMQFPFEKNSTHNSQSRRRYTSGRSRSTSIEVVHVSEAAVWGCFSKHEQSEENSLMKNQRITAQCTYETSVGQCLRRMFDAMHRRSQVNHPDKETETFH